MVSNQDNVPNATLVDYSVNQSKSPVQDNNISTSTSNDNSPPMAVLPLNSSAKLDQEPNPFEQSFSTVAVSDRPDKRSASISTTNSSNNSGGSGNSIHSHTGNNQQQQHLHHHHHQYQQQQKTILPPVAAITSPVPPLLRSGVLPKDVANQIAWNSLRAGPLSPSMLQGPQRPSEFGDGMIPASSSTTTITASISASSPLQQQQRPMSHIYAPDPALSFAMAGPTVDETPASNNYVNARSGSMSSSASGPSISSATGGQSVGGGGGTYQTFKQDHHYHQRQQRSRRSSSEANLTTTTMTTTTTTTSYDTNNDGDDHNDNNTNTRSKKRTRSSNDKDEDDEKRKNFLERNRIAALKCRQRKKQWLNNLQAKVEYLTNDNEQLQMQTNALREEIVNLKTLLLAHKDCPVAQQQQHDVFAGLQQQQQNKNTMATATNASNNNNHAATSYIHAYSHHSQQHPAHHHHHPHPHPHPSSTAEAPTAHHHHARFSSSPSSSSNSNTSNSANSMQQNMMTFSSHPQAQSMVAGTSGVLRF